MKEDYAIFKGTKNSGSRITEDQHKNKNMRDIDQPRENKNKDQNHNMQEENKNMIEENHQLN